MEFMIDNVDFIIDKIKELINQGKFKEAREYAKYINSLVMSHINNAHFYFYYSLTVRLTSKNGQDVSLLREIESEMKSCDNFTQNIYGDYLRDEALMMVRLGYTKKAQETVDEMLNYIENGDYNRKAAYKMVIGRINYIQHDTWLATVHHKEADLLWQTHEETADPQWIKNNRFHWLKAMAAQGYKLRYLFETAKEIRDSGDSNKTRLLRVKLIRFGRIANKIDDLMVRIKFK